MRFIPPSFKVTFTVCVILSLIVAGCKKKPAAPPPPEVQVIAASATNVPIFEEWVATLDGSVNAQIRAQVTGYLLKQNYTEGNEVKKGDLLFEIDPRPFQAALDQTQAKLDQDQAQAGKTQLDVKRYTPLAKEQAISQEELDNAVQANLAAKAQVKADEAAVENARLNLEFTKITSPVDGLAGTALAQVGDLVGQSGSVLTTVSTVDPIKVYFQVSEASYLSFWRHLVADKDENQNFPLKLILSDGKPYEVSGRFFYADRQINPNTGTLQIFALFPNTNFVLRPGQYGRVQAQTETKTNVIVVPQRAVTELQGMYQLSIVGDDQKVHLQPVTVGDQIGSSWIIEKGVKPGDKVIVEGTQKAKEGTAVNPQPYPRDTNEMNAASSPTNSSSASTNSN
jgi:membrane fusion protein (multidrug efflux system)